MAEETTAKRMQKSVSPIYDKSLFTKSFYQAVGSQYDVLRNHFKTLRQQRFVETVDWGIEYLERKYSVEPDKTMSLEQRRARLRLKSNPHRPLNPAVLERDAKALFNLEVEVGEKEAGYITLDVAVADKNTLWAFLNWLSLERPAHLMLHARARRQLKTPPSIGLATFVHGQKHLPRQEEVQIGARRIISTLGERQFIIEPTQVSVITAEGTTIIPIDSGLPSIDELGLKLAFPTSQRTITLANPREDLTIGEVDQVAAFAIDNELFLNKAKEAPTALTRVKLVSLDEYELEL